MSRLDHVAAVIGGVVATAARDAGRSRLVIVDRGGPETELLERVLLEAHVPLPVERVGDASGEIEVARAHARRVAGGDGLLIDPVNKTVALLWPELLAEPVLPLADLYATQVREMAGGWSAPAEAHALIERAGGIDAVDNFLAACFDQRRPIEEALARIPDVEAARAVRARLDAGWWWRRRVGVVPKLGARTLGIDLR